MVGMRKGILTLEIEPGSPNVQTVSAIGALAADDAKAHQS